MPAVRIIGRSDLWQRVALRSDSFWLARDDVQVATADEDEIERLKSLTAIEVEELDNSEALRRLIMVESNINQKICERAGFAAPVVKEEKEVIHQESLLVAAEEGITRPALLAAPAPRGLLGFIAQGPPSKVKE